MKDQGPTRIVTSIAQGVEGLRDRTAEVVASDGGSVLRELSKLARRIDDAEATTMDELTLVEQRLGTRLDRLAAAERRTTWPRRLFWLLLGAAGGAAAAYLADPALGRRRRHELGEHASAAAKQTAAQVSEHARAAAEQAAGAVADAAREVLNLEPEHDLPALETRVREQALDPREDTGAVEVVVDLPGAVRLLGQVPHTTDIGGLLDAVLAVPGVNDVISELTIAGG